MKIIVSGHSGRMGQEIKTLATQEGFKIVGLVDSKTQKYSFSEADVVIDFSSPENTNHLLQECAKKKTPIVIGTTAIDEKIFLQYQKQVPIFYSPNMSLGVYVLGEMITKLSLLKEYEFLIEETHHIHKKDSPSGTALMIQRILENQIKKKVKCKSIRSGDIFGVHKIIVKGPGETLTIEHEALNRSVFARGALVCAQKLIKKPVGMYTMKDLMND